MSKKGLNIVLLGPPGAGKGTQAGLLTKAYKLLHISTGDMLREAVKEASPIGRKVKDFMNSGKLVPDNIVTELVIGRMKREDASSGVILDGYPRTTVQAEALENSLKKENKDLDSVLYLRTSEEVAIQRLSGRRVCPECGKNYHIKNMPPKKEGICDICNVSLIQREDDKPETVRKRLVVYEESTKDLVSFYSRKGRLDEVDGDLSAEKLFDRIDRLFRQKGLIG